MRVRFLALLLTLSPMTGAIAQTGQPAVVQVVTAPAERKPVTPEANFVVRPDGRNTGCDSRESCRMP